jgi:hypothetical protein
MHVEISDIFFLGLFNDYHLFIRFSCQLLIHLLQ